MGLAADDFADEALGVDVEALADFFAYEAVLFGGGEYFGCGDDALDGGEGFEGVGEFVGAFGAGGFGFLFSHRSWVFCGRGGFGLFCLALQEGE